MRKQASDFINRYYGRHVNIPTEFTPPTEESPSVRTDLALESHELASHGTPNLEGVRIEHANEEQITVTRMWVETEAGARLVKKLPGAYTTIEVPDLRQKDPDLQERVTKRFAMELESFIHVSPTSTILVIGLGNWNVTPDALGPLVVEDLFITRHLFSIMPEVVEDGFRSLCAIAPGVLGLTGIETAEIVQGVVDRVHPDILIAIDALAARSIDRVNTTIQISDSGIQPGAGIGNRRKMISRETLGIPVISVGVPTVLDAATIASDAIDVLINHLEHQVIGKNMEDMLQQFSHEEKRDLISQVLQPLGHNLMVTPKEIDEFVDDIASVVATGLNVALHPVMTFEDAQALTH